MLNKLEEDKDKDKNTIIGDEIQIVYLILAHSNPQLLGRLVNVLDNDRVHFFIHIDKKADLNKFLHYLPARENIHLLEKRIKVFWAGYSMVKAILALMEEAIKSKIDFKYAVLLSGAHYPIKSNDYILRYFLKSDCEYLQFAQVNETGCEFKIDAYSLYDFSFFNPNTKFFENKLLNRIARLPGLAVNKIFRDIIPIIYKRKLVGNITPYTGANWWALTRPCVKYVLDFVGNNSDYADFFRLSIQPDETFFHSIICNSHFKPANSNITLNSLRGKQKQAGKFSKLKGLSLTFTKCTSAGTPKTLDEDEFAEVRKESNYFAYPCLFARKIDPDISLRLINLIDKEILRLNFDPNERLER